MIRKVERADGTIRFEAYGRRDGKKVYVGAADTERAARELIEDHRVTVRKVGRGELAPEHDTRRTFGKAVRLWLAKLEERGSRSHGEYADRVTLHMLPRFEDVPLVEIRRKHVTDWRDDVAAKVSDATANTVFGTMASAFSWFVEREWIEHSPCKGVKRLAAQERVFPWLQSSEAITRLLAECPDAIRSIVAVLVGTGMRLDEALHLRWDDVDLEHRLITVHRGRRGRSATGTTKSGKARRIPIFDSVLAVLKAMKLARGSSSLLFPGGERRLRGLAPERALSQAAVRIPFKAAAKRAGLPLDLRIHDLRHTFASLFLVDGGDIFKLSRILGHSTVAVTERYYAHLKPTAYAEDYGRVRFAMPTGGKVIALPVTA